LHDFFGYNIENAYIGPETPIFLDRQEDNQDTQDAQETKKDPYFIFDKITDELMRLEVSIDKTLERMERLASYEYGTEDCESGEIGDSLQEHLSNLISASNRLAGVKMGLFAKFYDIV